MSHPRFLRHDRPLPPRGRFLRHLARNAVVVLAFILVSLAAGALGYHRLAGVGWLDAFLNASMILTGMGPLAPLTTSAAKVFGIFYTLYSALAFLTVAAVLLGPVATRLLHRFHLDMYGDAE
jgi:hypothetical protein